LQLLILFDIVLASSVLERVDLLIKLGGNVGELSGLDELGALRWPQEWVGKPFQGFAGILSWSASHIYKLWQPVFLLL
jgi:hypothetical protein